MSVFTPQDIDEDDNVNVTKLHPLKEFFGLAISAVVIIVALYAATGFTLEWAAQKISVETENWIWSKLSVSQISSEKLDSATERQKAYAQKILNSLSAGRKPRGYDFRVEVTQTDEINAYALPGGHILLTSALLNGLGSENELAFVLGHELGHFAHRDHLRGMGFSFAALLVGIAATGENATLGRALSDLSVMTRLAYSRHDEALADQWGLETLHETYGNVTGASAFFRTLDEAERSSFTLPSILSTHPLTRDRIQAMETAIGKKGYKAGAARPLPWPRVLPAKKKPGTESSATKTP